MAEKKEESLFVLSNAPHVQSGYSVRKVMLMVIIALLPSAIYSVYIFGMNAFFLMAGSIVAAVVAEVLMQLLLKRPITVTDGSAVITGLLLAMNVPPEAPVWMVAIGSFFAIIFVKQIFGGLGLNIFNPALAARAFLMASWPAHMTTAWHKFSGVNVLSENIKNNIGLDPSAFDAITQATPLQLLKEGSQILAEYNISVEKLIDILFSQDMLKSLFIGNVGGCLGETSALLLLIGGLFLIIRKIITWHIPVSYIGTVALLSFLYYSFIGYPNVHMIVLFHILSGGLMLGAFFMATDLVTSPVTTKGMIIFGFGCGFITFIIRIWGGYPEGVSYSILLMNAVVPLIDRFTKPRVFGTNK